MKMLVWEYLWLLLCSWTPKPANGWRIFWLKTFGAKIHGRPFVHQRARIQVPWHITLRDRAAIGDRTNLYSLGEIIVMENATIAQEAYICTGTHAFELASFNLVTQHVVIGKNVFIGARAFVMPGVTIGNNSVIGACSVVTKSIPADKICAGQPCKIIRERSASDATAIY